MAAGPRRPAPTPRAPACTARRFGWGWNHNATTIWRSSNAITKRLSLVLLLALLAVLVVLPGAAGAASPATGAATAPVTGTYTDPVTGSVGSFAGNLTVTNVSAQNGQLIATAATPVR